MATDDDERARERDARGIDEDQQEQERPSQDMTPASFLRMWRGLLGDMRDEYGPIHRDALRRLLDLAERGERITAAIAIVDKHHNLGDQVYDVRERHGWDYVDGKPYEGESWQHPTVTAYGDAVETLRREGALGEPTPNLADANPDVRCER